jgi:hypothetical protein
LDPPTLSIGSTLPSFVAALGVGLVAAAVSRRRPRTVATGA